MNGVTHYKPPSACTAVERQDFAHLVCQGFEGAVDVDSRIRDAKWLALYYAPGDLLRAIAAIKAPKATYRAELFKKAGVSASPADYEIELGWVFVDPAHRGERIAAALCRSLLERVPAARVYSTTRINNFAMMRILGTLGFARVGKPYPRRNEELAVYLRA